MSAEREELRRLVEELPDEQVAAVLGEARRQLAPHRVSSWPPAWFGAIEADRTGIGRHHDDLLAEGFGTVS
jgi:hypothetical protein